MKISIHRTTRFLFCWMFWLPGLVAAREDLPPVTERDRKEAELLIEDQSIEVLLRKAYSMSISWSATELSSDLLLLEDRIASITR